MKRSSFPRPSSLFFPIAAINEIIGLLIEISLACLYYYIPKGRKITFSKEVLIPYKGRRNPETTLVSEVFLVPQEGANCELIVHAIVQARGYVLPHFLRAFEIYHDVLYTKPVDEISRIQTGDILGLSKTSEVDLMKAHVGLVLVNNGQNLLIHNSKNNGWMRTQSLEEVMSEEYRHLAWIKRPVIENPHGPNFANLKALGFESLAA